MIEFILKRFLIASDTTQPSNHIQIVYTKENYLHATDAQNKIPKTGNWIKIFCCLDFCSCEQFFLRSLLFVIAFVGCGGRFVKYSVGLLCIQILMINNAWAHKVNMCTNTTIDKSKYSFVLPARLHTRIYTQEFQLHLSKQGTTRKIYVCNKKYDSLFRHHKSSFEYKYNTKS